MNCIFRRSELYFLCIPLSLPLVGSVGNRPGAPGPVAQLAVVVAALGAIYCAVTVCRIRRPQPVSMLHRTGDDQDHPRFRSSFRIIRRPSTKDIWGSSPERLP